MNFPVPADHRVKIKENEKREKYLALARELKQLQNMKVTVIPIVVGELGTILLKGFQKRRKNLEIRGHVETTQASALLKLARILRRVLES